MRNYAKGYRRFVYPNYREDLQYINYKNEKTLDRVKYALI